METTNIRDLCNAFQVSKSSFYDWRNNPVCTTKQYDQVVLSPAINKAFEESRKTYGTIRIGDALKSIGIRTSTRRIRRIMAQDSLVPRQIKRFKSTTDSGDEESKIQDLVKREFTSDSPDKIWVGDITQIQTMEGVLYLAVVLDLFSRIVTGWATSDRKKDSLVINALVMAIGRRKPPKGFVFHSDHGSQYGSELFQSILKMHGGKSSMGSVGDCYDNAVAESFVHTLKGECLNDEILVSREYTERLIFDYIEVFYNRIRKHSFCKNMSPEQFEKCQATLA